MDKNTLVLISEAHEVALAKEHFPPRSTTMYYALTPRAMYALDLARIPYMIADDLDPDKKAIDIREEIHRTVLSFVDRADHIVHEYWQREPFVPPFRTNFYRLVRLFGSTRMHLYYLARAIEICSCQQIVLLTPPDYVLQEESFSTFGGIGCLETALLRFGGWPEIKRIDFIGAIKGRNKILQPRQSPLRQMYSILPVPLKATTRMLREFSCNAQTYLKRKMVPNSRRIVHWASGFQGCRNELERQGYFLELYLQNGGRYQNKENWPIETCIRLVRGELKRVSKSWENYDWTDFMMPLIKYLVSTAPYLSSVAKQTERYCREQRISAALTQVVSISTDQAIAEGFRMANVPIVVWQHGAYGIGESNRYLSFMDYSIADYMLTYGDSVSNHYEKELTSYGRIHKNQKIIAVGLLRKQPKNRMNLPSSVTNFLCKNQGRKVVAYATTNYWGRMSIGHNPPWYDTELYRAQRYFCETLDKLVSNSLCKVILKLHPGSSIPDARVWAKKEGWLVIDNECNWIDILDLCDAVLLDWPSTTLLESALTQKPIFITTRFQRVHSEALNLLTRRAIVHDDLEEVMQQLERFLINDEYPIDTHDEAFAQHYANPDRDSRTCELVADILDKVVLRRQVVGHNPSAGGINGA